MLTHKTLQDTYEEVAKVVADLRQETEQGALVVVEGSRDQRSLNNLGIDKSVIQLRRYREILAVNPEEFVNRKIIILTDFDREGELLSGRISKYLSQIGVSHNLSYRRRLKRLVRKGVHEIESIDPYFAKRIKR